MGVSGVHCLWSVAVAISPVIAKDRRSAAGVQVAKPQAASHNVFFHQGKTDGPKADGYHALQLGYRDKPRRKATKAESGHVSADLKSKRRAKGVRIGPKPNCEPKRHVREVRLDEPSTHAVGAVLTATDVFQKVKRTLVDSKGKETEVEDFPRVDVIGFTKGRGFQGVVKRHNYGGLRQSHGVKKGARQRGSMGSNASNRGSGRPKKGIRMAGRYGNEQVTVRHVDI